MQILTEQQKSEIHERSLGLLAKIGVKLDHDQARERVIRAGAKSGSEKNQIVFPPEMVAEAMQLAPDKARIATLNNDIIELTPESGQTFWTGAALNLLEDDASRPIRRNDLANIARVADTQACISAVTGTSIEDEHPHHRDFVGFRILAQNCHKHLRPLIFTKHGVEPVLEMAQVLSDGQRLREFPIFSLGYSIVSPFHWTDIPFEWYLKTRGTQLPMMINGEPLAGASSPVTLAGSILQTNAEILSGVIIYQVLDPGRPVIFNMGFAHTLDMRTAIALGGSPECSLMACAGTEMAKFYGLPCASWFASDSLCEDYQAAAEKTFHALLHALAGVNIIWGIGQMETQKALSLSQIILDAETVEYIRHFKKGIDFSESSLALDAILKENFKGQYLMHDHTLQNFKNDYYENRIFNRMKREHWQEKGGKTSRQRANDRVGQIIQKTEPLLSEQVQRELSKIEDKFKKLIS
ncbi:trimethylamine methyltransferase family protein [candidate division KSB1 bacterium]|nr:trimethylamine methyltransferase family protein [candidate division KSB1 bacterium]